MRVVLPAAALVFALTPIVSGEIHDQAMNGAAPTPILRETPSCTIHLEPGAEAGAAGGMVLTPAARSQSFDGCFLAPW
jgi:hypothetical protein